MAGSVCFFAWIAFAFFSLPGCQKKTPQVVVACAQDREYAESIFAGIEKNLALKVLAKYDTEANKSVGIAAELLAEKQRPRVDVHWNNEIIATIRLSRENVYEAYQSPSSQDYPAWTRGKDWQAFAARARVLIVNKNLVAEKDRPSSIYDLADPKWKGQIAIAKPLFGTTATHAACLFQALGTNDAKAFFAQLKQNQANIVAGNKQVARGVADGKFAFGLTDSDDAIIEMNDGKPVEIVYPDRTASPRNATLANLGVLYIPNTIALIRNGPNPAQNRQAIDQLLSPETELKLAQAGGFQIPLHARFKGSKDGLHPAIVLPGEVKVMQVDFEKAADLWAEVQEYIKTEFLKE